MLLIIALLVAAILITMLAWWSDVGTSLAVIIGIIVLVVIASKVGNLLDSTPLGFAIVFGIPVIALLIFSVTEARREKQEKKDLDKKFNDSIAEERRARARASAMRREQETGVKSLTRARPWHSDDSDVYHECKKCNAGNSIEAEKRRPGTGGKIRCSECNKLARGGNC